MIKINVEISGVHLPKTQLGLTKMNQIISAAEQLFVETGFYETSISDICKRAKIATGTFYIYFDTKTALYRCLIQRYEVEIKNALADSIKGCKTRYEKEREGIRCFVKYSVNNPHVYNIIWGSLAVDSKIFSDYYESFAKSYIHALERDEGEMVSEDTATLAYMLMGISNFIGLRAIFEGMDDESIDKLIDETLMPALSNGMFKK